MISDSEYSLGFKFLCFGTGTILVKSPSPTLLFVRITLLFEDNYSLNVINLVQRYKKVLTYANFGCRKREKPCPACIPTSTPTCVRHVFFSSNFSSMQKKRARHCPTLNVYTSEKSLLCMSFKKLCKDTAFTKYATKKPLIHRNMRGEQTSMGVIVCYLIAASSSLWRRLRSARFRRISL